MSRDAVIDDKDCQSLKLLKENHKQVGKPHCEN